MKNRKGKSRRPESRGSELPPQPPVKPVVNHLELLEQIEKGPCTHLATPDGTHTIQSALDRANAGDCLALAPGLYDHSFIAPASPEASSRPLRIFGVVPDPEVTVLSGGGHITTSHAFRNISFSGGIFIESGAPRFTKCVFSGPNAALSVLSSARPRLINCKIHSFGTSGLYAFPGSSPQLHDCVISGPDDPALLGPAEGPAVGSVGVYVDNSAVEVMRCKVSKCGTGMLFVDSCNDTVVKDTSVVDCVGVGIHSTGGAAPVIIGSKVSGCAARVGVAVRLEARTRARLTNCCINGEV